MPEIAVAAPANLHHAVGHDLVRFFRDLTDLAVYNRK
jgi:hypothetical protein